MRSLLLWSGSTRARIALAVLVLLAGALAVLPARHLWVGSWKAALDQGTGSLLLIGCVCGGAAAYTYGTMSTREWDVYVAGMRRGLTGWLGPVAGVWLLGVAGMLLCTGLLVLAATAYGATATPGMLGAIPLVTATLAAEVAFGAVLGATMPRPFSVPLATAVPFFLEGFSRGGAFPGVFRTGGVTGDLGGQTYSWRVLLLSAMVCALIALALVLVLSLHVLPSRALPVGLMVAALVAVVPLWWSLESQGHERYAWQADPALACAGHDPEVCLSADTTRPLRSLAEEAHRQASPLRALGVRVPRRFTAPMPGRDTPDEGHLVLAGDQATSDRADAWLVALSLATPAGCPEFSSSQVPTAALGAQHAMALWIYEQSVGRSSAALPGSPATQWLDQKVEEQRAWVVGTYAALRECRLGDLQTPYASQW